MLFFSAFLINLTICLFGVIDSVKKIGDASSDGASNGDAASGSFGGKEARLRYFNFFYNLIVTWSGVGYGDDSPAFDIFTLLISMLSLLFGVGLFFPYSTSGLVHLFHSILEEEEQIRRKNEELEGWLTNLEQLLTKTSGIKSAPEFNKEFLALHRKVDKKNFYPILKSSFFNSLDKDSQQKVSELPNSITYEHNP